jgi:hypothetical protein
MSKVEPIAVPFGRQAEGTESKNRVPRTPFGPSESRIEGMPSLGIGTVCQKSLPAQKIQFCPALLSSLRLNFIILTSSDGNLLLNR